MPSCVVYGASLVSVVHCVAKWPLWYVPPLVYRSAVGGIPEVPCVVDARRRRSSRDTQAMYGWGSGVHTRPKFEIGDVELLARKRELSSAPGTTNTRPLGEQTETPEFGVPLNPEHADFRRGYTGYSTTIFHGDRGKSSHRRKARSNFFRRHGHFWVVFLMR